jgi:hypothetical protein
MFIQRLIAENIRKCVLFVFSRVVNVVLGVYGVCKEYQLKIRLKYCIANPTMFRKALQPTAGSLAKLKANWRS